MSVLKMLIRDCRSFFLFLWISYEWILKLYVAFIFEPNFRCKYKKTIVCKKMKTKKEWWLKKHVCIILAKENIKCYRSGLNGNLKAYSCMSVCLLSCFFVKLNFSPTDFVHFNCFFNIPQNLVEQGIFKKFCNFKCKVAIRKLQIYVKSNVRHESMISFHIDTLAESISQKFPVFLILKLLFLNRVVFWLLECYVSWFCSLLDSRLV